MSLKQEFATQLRRLHQLAREFGEDHPDVSQQLALDDCYQPDPHVERLLEGVAFLAAQMRHEWQLGMRDLQQLLLQQLAPDLARPFPAMTLLQMSGMTTPIPVPLGTSFQATVDPEWQVQTTRSLTLFPLKLTSIQQDNEWRWVLTATHDCIFQLSELPFTVIAPHAEAQTWIRHLMTDTLWLNGNGRRFSAEWKWQWREPVSTLLEYFHAPALLYRFNCQSDHRIELKDGDTIEFICRTLSAFPPLPESALQINVLPVQLTQTVAADPIRTSPIQFDYPLTFTTPGTLYHVDRVIAKNAQGEARLFLPYRGEVSALTPHYTVSFDSHHSTLKLISEIPLVDSLVSCDARLCREAASWVRSTFHSRSGNIPHYIQAKNLFRPTRRQTPPWQNGSTCERVLLSGLLSSPTQLFNDNRLSTLIRQFNWHPQNQFPLDVLRTSYRSIVDSGVLYRILRIECHAGDSAFEHLSQAWIFTQVLQGFIEHLLEIGMRAEIKLDWGEHQVVAP